MSAPPRLTTRSSLTPKEVCTKRAKSTRRHTAFTPVCHTSCHVIAHSAASPRVCTRCAVVAASAHSVCPQAVMTGLHAASGVAWPRNVCATPCRRRGSIMSSGGRSLDDVAYIGARTCVSPCVRGFVPATAIRGPIASTHFQQRKLMSKQLKKHKHIHAHAHACAHAHMCTHARLHPLADAPSRHG